jgi:hypothetical protein
VHEDAGKIRDPEAAGATTGMNRERDILQVRLERCERDLEQARRELAEARKIQESLTEQLYAGRAADMAALPAPPPRQERSGWRDIWRRLRMPAHQRAVQQDVRVLRASKWFDADWYVTEYPDVANSGTDPAEHYLCHGAAEGRDPGPQFSTEAYLRDHPELAGSGVNPLLHFLRSGGGSGA